MEMRRRGYDVIARSSAKGFTDSQWKEWFQNPKLEKPNLVKRKGESRKAFVNRGYDTMCQMIEKHGDGSRGYIGTTYEGVFSGHAMYWEVSGGRVKFYDGQNGSTNNDKVFALSDPNGYSIVRLDNLKLKPEVTKMCRSNDTTVKGKR